MEEAVQSGDVQRVQVLIQSGVSVNAQYSGGSLLIQAIARSHNNIALTLLEAGADVCEKDDMKRTALHWACIMKLEDVVQALVDSGSRVNEININGFTPLWHADGNVAITMTLLRAGASCKWMLKEQMNELCHYACRAGDVSAIGTLIHNGCDVSTLPREEQEKLLHYACREHNALVAGALIMNGCHPSEQTQTDIPYLAIDLPKQEKEQLLYYACSGGYMLAVESLIAVGCNVNCLYAGRLTPVMVAAREGHKEIVKKLILASANLAIQDTKGRTALHYAAMSNHTQCGVLLAEGGASVTTKNQFSQTPLDVPNLSAEFKEAIKETLSFTTQKTLCITGNAEGGKSTLIAALQAESTGFVGRIFNHFRRVNDHLKRTAGIAIVPHYSKRYGKVLFFDFAGQDDYHGPHQMFLEALLSKPRVSMTLLLVIKMTESEESILHQLHRWLTPVALMSTTASPPHVIVIGSFLDKVRSRQEATDKLNSCVKATEIDLAEFPLWFVGTCFLNCRQPQSEGIDQLCTFLQDVPVPELSAAHTGYSLAWVLFQIRRSSINAQALQLQEFSAWITENKDDLPQTMPDPEEVCRDLSAAGHALYLPKREDPPKSWLVLDLPSILHNVYGALFSRFKEIANEFSLLHCRHLDKLFPDLDMDVVKQVLISLEFCIPVDPAVLKVDLSKLTQKEETSGWLFFPALISAKPPQSILEVFSLQSGRYLCWQLKTSKKHFIYACILQTVLLRLAAHFVVKQYDEEGVRQQYCSIWCNGIAWQSNVGVDVIIHIAKNRVIQVIGMGKMTATLHQYLADVITDILRTVQRFAPKLAAAAFIVHPPMRSTSPECITATPPMQLFPLEMIRRSIMHDEHSGVIFSLKDGSKWMSVPIADLFGELTPSLGWIDKITWTQPEPNHPRSLTELGQSQSPAEQNQTTEENGVLTSSEFQIVPSGARALLDISSTPDMRDVDELVVTRVAVNWERLALRLGVEGCVSEVVFKNHPNDYEGACREMLDRWLRGDRHTGKEERTWSTLLTALDRAGFVDLEKSLRREHFKIVSCM